MGKDLNRRNDDHIQDALSKAQMTADGLESTVLQVRESLTGVRELLKDYQRTRNHWERHAQVAQRANENWIPSISADVDSSQAVADQLLETLPPLEDRLNSQLERYKHGRQVAAKVQTQLEWHAASWWSKLRQIAKGEVNEKRVKLLRIVAPFVLAAVVVILILIIGRLSLSWTMTYYRNLRRALKF